MKPTMQGVPARGTLILSQPLATMSPVEGRLWIEGLRDRLQAKQEREQAYLDRRAKRGVRTPTDEAYEADQQLENELLALIEKVLEWLNEGQGGI